MRPAQDFYRILFSDLHDAHISSPSQMPVHGLSFYYPGLESYWKPSKDVYETVYSFAHRISRCRDILLTAVKSTGEPCFFFKWDDLAQHSNDHRQKRLAEVATASLVMGHITIVLTSPWNEYADGEEDYTDMSSDYWDALFLLRPLVLAGRIIVLPSHFQAHVAQMGVAEWEQFGDNAAICPDGHLLTIGERDTIKYCHSRQSSAVTTIPESLPAFVLPIVSMNDMELFLDFAHRYETSLRRFKAALMCLIASNGNDRSSLTLELNRALLELDDRIHIMSKEMRLKGLKFSTTAAAFVAASLLPSDVSRVLTMLTGANTILNGVELLTTARYTAASVRDADFWFPWAWNRTKG